MRRLSWIALVQNKGPRPADCTQCPICIMPITADLTPLGCNNDRIGDLIRHGQRQGITDARPNTRCPECRTNLEELMTRADALAFDTGEVAAAPADALGGGGVAATSEKKAYC